MHCVSVHAEMRDIPRRSFALSRKLANYGLAVKTLTSSNQTAQSDGEVVLVKPQWIGIVDKALASHSWCQGSNPAETLWLGWGTYNPCNPSVWEAG